jgi:protein-arginine kinase
MGLDSSKISLDKIDESGKYVLGCRMRLGRNLQSARFPPAVLPEERQEIEKKLTTALSQLDASYSGKYSSLQSLTLRADEEDVQALDGEGLIFDEPESGIDLSSGIHREWPDARGVFVNGSYSVAAWVNYRNHIRLIVTLPGGLVKKTFEDLCNIEASMRKKLQQNGDDYAWSDRLGFLTADPSQVGFAGFRMSFLMRLPFLGDTEDFMQICRKLGVEAKVDCMPDSTDTWLISKSGQFGVPEFETVNRIVSACRKLMELDAALEARAGEDLGRDASTETGFSESIQGFSGSIQGFSGSVS